MTTADLRWIVPLVGALLAWLCLWRAYVAGRRFLLVENLPTSKTTGVFIGLVELKGTAETDAPYTSYLSATQCVLYSWSVEERWSRTVTETYQDSNGRTQTRTRRETGWTNVGGGEEKKPFYLLDDCGAVLVRPEGAKIEPTTVFSETCGPGDPLYYGKGPVGSIMNSDNVRRFSESAIPLHAELYLVGQARERDDVVAPEIAADPLAPLFLISTREEKAVSRGFRGWRWGWMILGLLLVVGSLILGVAATDGDIDTQVHEYVIGAAIYLACGFFGWALLVYNGLIDLRQRVNSAWAQVDVQLKRRFDLIPGLVEIVQALRGHEQGLQTDLASLRSQLTATSPGAPGENHHALGATVAGIAERYPDLKADTAFQNLQKQLADTENRIALARGYFNEIATYFNTRLQVFPDSLIASLSGMKPRTLMEAGDFERAPVKVDYA